MLSEETFEASNGILVDDDFSEGLLVRDPSHGPAESRMLTIQARKTQAIREYFQAGSVDSMTFPAEFSVSWVAAPTTTDAEIDLLDKVTNILISLSAAREKARTSLSPSREKPLGDWALEILRAVQK